MLGIKLSIALAFIIGSYFGSIADTQAADNAAKQKSRVVKAKSSYTQSGTKNNALQNQPPVTQDSNVCVYKDEHGVIQQVKSLKEVPTKSRHKAECKKASEFSNLASPEKMDIAGSEQKTTVSTALGKMEVRLERGAAKYFARLPTKALMDAAQAVNRGLSKGGFPHELRSADYPWKVIFLDKELPETQIPLNLVSNCNPAWMTPPGNIYVIAQRVAGECNGQGRLGPKRFTDTQLAEALVHEMAHAIEYHLLKGKNPGSNSEMRMRAEGFATWFTGFASGYSAVIDDKVLSEKYKMGAAKEIATNTKEFQFEGTAGDYARASMYFKAVQSRKGTAGIIAMYDLMANENLDFFSAITKVTGWSKKEIEKQVLKAAT